MDLQLEKAASKNRIEFKIQHMARGIFMGIYTDTEQCTEMSMKYLHILPYSTLYHGNCWFPLLGLSICDYLRSTFNCMCKILICMVLVSLVVSVLY